MKFKVKVDVVARTCYEVEVEATNSAEAEQKATLPEIYEEELGNEFSVDKAYLALEADAEQITFECDECKAVLPSHTVYCLQDGMCVECLAKAVRA